MQPTEKFFAGGIRFEKRQPQIQPENPMNFLKQIFSLLFLALLASITIVKAQQPVGTKVPYIIEGEDTIPVVNLPIVNITELGPDYMKNLQAYYRLRFNVIKVYPYAKLAALKINQLNDTLSKMHSDHDRRRYTKEFEKQLRTDFEKQIENLSVNQG